MIDKVLVEAFNSVLKHYDMPELRGTDGIELAISSLMALTVVTEGVVTDEDEGKILAALRRQAEAAHAA